MTRIFVPADDQPQAGGYTRIVVLPEWKIRYRGGPLHHQAEYQPDRSWVLYRREVPALTSEQWYACPTGWKLEGSGGGEAPKP